MFEKAKARRASRRASLRCAASPIRVGRFLQQKQSGRFLSSKPSMGYLYGAMDKAKEEIATNFGNVLSKYKEIWDIIDEKWDFQMHRDLHAAAYYLNPQFRYEPNFSRHLEVSNGLYNCMDKLIPNKDERSEAHVELDKYVAREGLFGRPEAEATRLRRTPARWWAAYGVETPILMKFAVRILSLTSTSSACERNWSTFNQIHTKKRNRLGTTKLNALAFVMYNKRLRAKQLRKRNRKEEDALVVDEIDSEDEWLVHENEDTSIITSNWEKNLDELDINNLQKAIGESSEEMPQVVEKRKEPSQPIRKKGGSSKKGRKDGGKKNGKAPMELVDEEEDEWGDFLSDEENDQVVRSNEDGDGTSDDEDENILG